MDHQTHLEDCSCVEASGAFVIGALEYAQSYEAGFSYTVKFLRSKGANADEAEEVAQAAWVRGWEARHQLRSRERTIVWVNTIAFRRFRRGRASGRLNEERLGTLVAASAGEVADSIDWRLLLRRCRPLDQHLLEKRYYEGLQLREIADSQGMTEMAVRVRIHRCRADLRKLMTPAASMAVQDACGREKREQ